MADSVKLLWQLDPYCAGAPCSWGVGVFAYAVALFHRSSLAVAGLAAAERLHINASVLSLLSVTQLAMYAVIQVASGKWC